MVKHNDLRAGNYLISNNDSVRDVVHDGIVQITSAGISKIEKGNDDEYDTIPLTEEWLLWFGFVKVKDESFHPEDYEWIYEKKWENGESSLEMSVGKYTDGGLVVFLYSGDGLDHIQFVHQLQNLYYALTGEDLILKPELAQSG